MIEILCIALHLATPKLNFTSDDRKLSQCRPLATLQLTVNKKGSIGRGFSFFGHHFHLNLKKGTIRRNFASQACFKVDNVLYSWDLGTFFSKRVSKKYLSAVRTMILTVLYLCSLFWGVFSASLSLGP